MANTEQRKIQNGRELYNRPPRLQPELPTLTIEIPEPPEPSFKNTKIARLGIYISLGTIVTILLATILVAFLSSPGTLAFILIAVVAGFGTIITQLYNIIKERSNDKTNQTRYAEILIERQERMSNYVSEQRMVQNRLYPSVESEFAMLDRRDTRLWERRPADADFLTFRIGVGTTASNINLRAPNPDRSAPQLEEALNLTNSFREITQMPILVELEKQAFWSLCGDYRQARPLLSAVIAHLAFHHSPDEVKIAMIYDPTHVEDWKWLGWLPHCRIDAKAKDTKINDEIVLLASQTDQFDFLMNKIILTELNRRVNDLSQNNNNFSSAKKMYLPRFIFFVENFELVRHHPALLKIFQYGDKTGFYLVSLSPNLQEAPEQCRVRTEFLPNGNLSFGIVGTATTKYREVVPDMIAPGLVEQYSLSMTPLKPYVSRLEDSGDLKLRLLEMLEPPVDVSGGQLPDPLYLWQQSSVAQLKVPIGRKFGGDPLIIDFSDKGYGPHSLIAGTTGSGKSVLLQIIVSALAIHNNPDNLNFILADFKGAATFKPFAKLPHVAGMFSDLNDNAQLERALNSLLAEKVRREKLLHEADVANIYDYQRKRDQPDKPKEPLPFLFIIIDEFAEMKARVSDFMGVIDVIARTGRTLGMHLFLATQRADGVIAPQVDSNLKLRICLRVETAADSSAMLGRRDAAEIPREAVGRAFLKCGPEFETFQVGRVDQVFGPDIESERKRKPDEIRVLESSWRPGPLVERKIVANKTNDEETVDLQQYDYDVITEQCMIAARRLVLRNSHRPWQEPLAKVYTLPELYSDGIFDVNRQLWPEAPPLGLGIAPLGKIDIVEQQKQTIWQANLYKDGAYCITGMSQSGRSMFLRTLATSLVLTHRPDDLHLYIIDMGNNLKTLQELPHTAGYYSFEQKEELRKFFVTLLDENTRRQSILNEKDVQDIKDFHSQNPADKSLPFILVIFDNFSKLDRHEPPYDTVNLRTLIREGRSKGIYIAITMERHEEYEYGRYKDMFYHISLRQSRELIAFNIPKGMLGSWNGVPGRGFIQYNLNNSGDSNPTLIPLEVQIALPYIGNPGEQATALANLGKAMQQALATNYNIKPPKLALESSEKNIANPTAEPAKPTLPPAPILSQEEHQKLDKTLRETNWGDLAEQRMKELLQANQGKPQAQLPAHIIEILGYDKTSQPPVEHKPLDKANSANIVPTAANESEKPAKVIKQLRL